MPNAYPISKLENDNRSTLVTLWLILVGRKREQVDRHRSFDFGKDAILNRAILALFSRPAFLGTFERRYLAYCVEKGGFPKTLEYWGVKTPLLHAAMWNPSTEPSAKNAYFNLRCVLF